MANRFLISVSLMLGLAACGGNPLGNTGTDPETPGGGTPSVVVPDTLKGSVDSIVYDADTETFQIAISGLDTTPVVATWARRPSMDVAGYLAFAVQEDALDRLFVGLAAESSDKSVRAAVAGDGGQFNRVFAGTIYQRTGAYTPPDATGPGPAAGQVSYAGSYVGLMNGGGDGSELIAPPPGTDPTLLPGQPARVTGDVFINANFGDNLVNGAVINRVIVDGAFGLESIVLVPTSITTAGTFTGEVERYIPNEAPIGVYGGVFGGTDAASVAGAIMLTDVFDDTNTLMENATERGIFVLTQCGLPGDDALCAGAAP